MLELKIGDAEKSLDWLQWSSSLVSSLAWPVAAVIIAWIFHSQIAALLTKVRKLSWGDKAVDFADQLDKIENVSLAARSGPVDENEMRAPLPDERFQQLLAISPPAAIIDAWGPIEGRLITLAKRFADDAVAAEKLRRSTPQTIELLFRRKVISANSFEVLRELQDLRNAAAHAQDVTPTDAIRFKALADEAMRQLERI